MAFHFKQFLLHLLSTRTVLSTGLHDIFDWLVFFDFVYGLYIFYLNHTSMLH